MEVEPAGSKPSDVWQGDTETERPMSFPEVFATTKREHDDIAALSGIAGASGRDGYVGGQIGQAERAARAQPATDFGGELYRAVPERFADAYSDHSKSNPGRYNAPGQSTLYTALTMEDVKAEAGNYSGLGGRAVVRSRFDGSLLDLRPTPGVMPGALMEPYGGGGQHRSVLSRATGEDPYTLPRALGDVARERGLSGVMVPANGTHTNVALFPDDPNRAAPGPGRIQSGLRALDAVEFKGGTTATPRPFEEAPRNVPDELPNQASPAGKGGVALYSKDVGKDVGAHGRASGARYGAAGAALVSVAQGALHGHVDARQVASNAGLGAVSGKAETMLARRFEGALHAPATPPNVAGGLAANADENAARLALRPTSLAAGAGAAGVVGAVVGGGVTAWNDADRVKDGRMSAGQATADVAVQAGVGLGAGAAGAAAGAAVGSVVPVAGTAVGAVVGFGVGMATGWVAQHSGAVDEAEHAAGDYLTQHFEKPLQAAWHGVADGVDGAKHLATDATHAISKVWDSIF